ncbi:peptidoglycan/LPS O-acetylase OafA/YrhL [Salsuginibacillus halophilus]|uniref:Peptidoglycan/LPS O-acetylase OafA/YrhL n=1 Tax=Salsuginibacillus halophilus TaxID=517424 RepID=A0A2P8HQB8_9BACI|nr:acyltransferase family protein [Salsuginibacillus halophilus]PSL48408.1 peptidoglycan/LPS O-acetylase OafA/YrhL [Salsuginibacillus halophilus]
MNDLRVPAKQFRPELEGLRAVAAFLVAVYHIWLGSVSGGVDVFFVVSGYLITTSLLSRVERDGTIKFFEYILGLARRLFPAAFTVLLFIIVTSYFLFSESRWDQVVAETFASAFYFQNWQLAFDAVDYLAKNNEASPLQHFWALSIQGQFYVLWPLLIFLSFLAARKIFKTPLRKTLLGVLMTVAVLSLAYSVYITTVNQPWAYFDTFARVWEFSAGGLIALVLPYITLNRSASFVLGWAGIAIVAFTGLLLPVTDVFPGYAAILPVTGALLVIISGQNGGTFGVHRLVASKPLVFFGGLSYAFYLWHWPLLIFYYQYTGAQSVSLQAGALLIIISFVAAYVSTKIIEKPVRGMDVKTLPSKLKLTAVLLIFILPAVVLNSLWAFNIERETVTEEQTYDTEDYPGAAVIYDDVQAASDVEPVPSFIDIRDDLPSYYDEFAFANYDDADIRTASFGVTDDPSHTIALVGGSHAGHWLPALEEAAEEIDIQIDTYINNGCRLTDDDADGWLNDACMEWNEEIIDVLREDSPDLIFTTGSVGPEPNVPDGFVNQWENLEDVAEILAVRDTPRMREDVPDCLEAGGNKEECSVERSEELSDHLPWEAPGAGPFPDHVSFADFTDYLCDEELCYPVIGNVIVYRDTHHLSSAYSRTLGEPVKEALIEVLEDLN